MEAWRGRGAALRRPAIQVILAAAMLITACGAGNTGSGGETGSAAALAVGEENTAEAAVMAEAGTDVDHPEAGKEDAAGTAAGEQADGRQLAPGERPEEGGPSAGEAAGIVIGLPRNENWCSDPVFSTEEGKVEQVLFHDEITGSDAVLRASREEDGDPSVFYYMFDDSKKETWAALGEDGTNILVTVEVTIDNSDIPGVLATWKHDGALFALWEDDAVDAVDSVAKLAVAIAERSR